MCVIVAAQRGLPCTTYTRLHHIYLTTHQLFHISHGESKKDYAAFLAYNAVIYVSSVLSDYTRCLHFSSCALLRDCLGGEMQRLSSKLSNNIAGRLSAKQLALSLTATTLYLEGNLYILKLCGDDVVQKLNLILVVKKVQIYENNFGFKARSLFNQ